MISLAVAFTGMIGWSIDWGSGVAIPESLTAFPACFWFLMLAMHMFKGRLWFKNKTTSLEKLNI